MTDDDPLDAATPLIAALRNSHDRLRALAEPLDEDALVMRSYASEWSIAQVLSHLGSGAEIFTLLLDAGLHPGDATERESNESIWARWNAKTPRQQATDALEVDCALVERLGSITRDQAAAFRVQLFGRESDLAGLVRARLAEHAIHTWDIAVALDAAATVPRDAVDQLIDTFSPIVGFTAKPAGRPWRVRIVTTEPDREFVLDASDAVSLVPSTGGEELPTVRMPGESLYRLVYGRLDPDHTPALGTTDVDIDELRARFPGF